MKTKSPHSDRIPDGSRSFYIYPCPCPNPENLLVFAAHIVLVFLCPFAHLEHVLRRAFSLHVLFVLPLSSSLFPVACAPLQVWLFLSLLRPPSPARFAFLYEFISLTLALPLSLLRRAVSSSCGA